MESLRCCTSPRLSLSLPGRAWLAGTLSITMILEMLAIAIQAARGTTSHFNQTTPLDHAIWNVMGAAIVVASVAMLLAAIVGHVASAPRSARPPAAPRAGARLARRPVDLPALGGDRLHDGRSELALHRRSRRGPGLPVVNWSTTHGDLRVSHFLSLHAWQLLPLLGWLVLRAPLGPRASVALVAVASIVLVGLCLGALAQARLGRPLL